MREMAVKSIKVIRRFKERRKGEARKGVNKNMMKKEYSNVFLSCVPCSVVNNHEEESTRKKLRT